MSSEPKPDVVATIGICTRDRPDELHTLLRSISQSRFSGERPHVQVVVVENGPNTAGLDPDELGEMAGWPVHLVHEPRPGVAFARNAVIRNRARGARWLLMVDDDEVVTRGWLEAQLSYAATSNADVITGPVLTAIPENAPEWARILWRNVPRRATGTEQPSFLGGNVCFRSDLFEEIPVWFDERRALATADDTSLGRRLVAAGYTIVWNDRAIAWERVHAARLTHRWMWQRFLSFGGFESMYSVEHHGLAATLRDGAWPTMKQFVAGLGNAALARDPHRHAAAVADLATSCGWVAGLFGRRVDDYREMTSQ